MDFRKNSFKDIKKKLNFIYAYNTIQWGVLIDYTYKNILYYLHINIFIYYNIIIFIQKFYFLPRAINMTKLLKIRFVRFETEMVYIISIV